jgi:hypothetical protein
MAMGGAGASGRGPALITALIVLILLLCSHFVDGWNWPPRAFVVVGVLVFSLGFTYQLVTRNRDAIAYRAAVGIAFAAGFLLMWGTSSKWPTSLLSPRCIFGVPMVGVIGAAVARLRPNGMARALFITALAQALVLAAALIILITRNPQVTSWTAPELRGFCGNAFFAMLFAGSALLFRKAANVESASGAV